MLRQGIPRLSGPVLVRLASLIYRQAGLYLAISVDTKVRPSFYPLRSTRLMQAALQKGLAPTQNSHVI